MNNTQDHDEKLVDEIETYRITLKCAECGKAIYPIISSVNSVFEDGMITVQSGLDGFIVEQGVGELITESSYETDEGEPINLKATEMCHMLQPLCCDCFAEYIEDELGECGDEYDYIPDMLPTENGLCDSATMMM